MSWREAKSLLVLLAQVNAMFPSRSKDSDGQIGDQAHAARHSDHNPVGGVVHALDITHDPAHGFNSYTFADYILAQQDKRLSYVISNHRIGSGPHGPSPGVWRKYTGSNPHDHHCHISAVAGAAADDTAPWKISGVSKEPVPQEASGYIAPPATVRVGDSGDSVKRMQTELGVTITGEYKARSETEFALKLFQVRKNLEPDGVCGPQTWLRLHPAAFLK